MLCQSCRKNQATVKVTTIINGQKTETHLCEECARKTGEMNFIDPPTIQQLLANLLAQQMGGEITLGGEKTGEAGAPVPPEKSGPEAPETPFTVTAKAAVKRCPTCGMTFNQFRQIGRLGCSDCYRTFDRSLEPLLQRIHGGHLHGGKVPSRAGGELKQRREMAQLKEQMFMAVAKEDFEGAAVIRDRIRELEKGLSGPDGGDPGGDDDGGAGRDGRPSKGE